jgi:type I restriction enzyme R subunit
MTFDKELDFESALINVLKTKGWDQDVIKNPTEKDLIKNWADILFNNNKDRDRLNEYPLTDGEMMQILEQINTLRTPLKLNGYINGKTISIVRDNPDDVEHFHKEVSLKIYDRDEIAAGSSRYQIVEQPIFDGVDNIDFSRRGDLTLLINGMPVIHIELKKSDVPVSDATYQIQKYSDEGKFKGIYSLIQIFVAMTPEETVYFSNPGDGGKFNSDFYFHWEDFNNEIVNNWKDVASSLLSIPMAHQLIGFYTVADDTDGVLKVMRSYQYYAANAISDKVSKINFDDNNNMGGYIWHTTGSGKTMTSFKSAELIANSRDADKVIFLMDRIELGTQSLREYRGFADSSSDVQGTENTDVLKTKLKSDDPKYTLIVTSIQKMSRIKDEGFNTDDINAINNKRLVFIVDECHRDVFGDMMVSIKKTFPKAIMFGFTGTPILGDNIKLTANVFGDELHRYSISDGIRDKNVLGFDTFKVCTFKDKDIRNSVGLSQAKSSDIVDVYADEKKVAIYNDFLQNMPMEKDIFDADWNVIGHGVENYLPVSQYETSVHHNAVVDNILDGYIQTSRNKKYSAIFATSSIKEAIEYYHIFKGKNSGLRIVGLFDPSINNNDWASFKEQGLKEIVEDYNSMYGMSFTLSQYDKMKTDITSRFARKKPYVLIEDKDKIDILIVVDQLLTGFDSKWINTLYLDKVLRDANIIQAFSRTNRICDKLDKNSGIIKYYRYPNSMEKYIQKAVAEYSGNKTFGIFVAKLSENIKSLNSLFDEIHDIFKNSGFDDFESLPSAEADRKKLSLLYKKFKKTFISAELQGLRDSDFVDGGEVGKFEVQDSIMEVETSDNGSFENGHGRVDFSLGDMKKIDQRMKDLSFISKTNGSDSATYDLDSYISETEEDKINYDYLNSKFEKYLRDLGQHNITREEFDSLLDNIHSNFAYLSVEQQKYADIFLRDIQCGNIVIESGKNFLDYIGEYKAKAANDKFSMLADALGLDKSLLMEMSKLNLNEKNIDEFGRFDRLKKTVDINKAKVYLEQVHGSSLNLLQVNIFVDKLLRDFILFDKI